MTKFKTIINKAITWIKEHWKLLGIITLVVLGISFFLYRRSQAAQPVLTFTKPEVKDIAKTLEISGVVDAKEKANLRFAAGGKIVYLGAKTGDSIKKNQTIATIDRAQLQKQLQQDLNAYTRERLDWETTQDGSDYPVEPLVERREIDKEQTQLNDTVLTVEIRDIAIRNTVLSAPFAGILVTSPTNVVGVNVLASEAFEVVNPDSLVFLAAVDESDLSLVKLGLPTELTLDAYPNEPIQGNVNFIAYKSQQSGSGTTVFVVEIPLTGSDLLSRYRLGMNGDAQITLDTRTNVLTIPLDATRDRDGKTFVDVRTGENTAEEREIQTGLMTDNDVEVMRGLTTNDEVVLP